MEDLACWAYFSKSKNISNMKPIYHLLFTICSVLFLTSCPDKDPSCDYSLKIINGSDTPIVFWFFIDSSQACELPDSLPIGLRPGNIESWTVMANSQKEFLCTPSGDIDVFENNCLFLFSSIVVQGSSWEVIQNENLYLYRMDVGVEDLEAMDWIVEYP